MASHISPARFNTLGIATATTPAVVTQFLKHIWHRSAHRSKGNPQAQLTYDEGLAIVRSFLQYASHHTVEELQGYTAMRIPAPHWVKKQIVPVAQSSVEAAEELFAKHMQGYGEQGLTKIGGSHWWRQRGRPLTGEWIEMKKDFVARAARKVEAAKQANGTTPAVEERVILYCHGGASFFSSNETHRYQITRHARKIGGRAFSPSYRLSPQYPFPCGLVDLLASYLFLIDPPEDALHEAVAPQNLVLSGDSHGAGMILSLLCILRDEGLPMPAGGVLISPWLDLAHSFPSIVGDASGDYIPPVGFHFEPSLAWPPIAGDGIDVEIDGKTVHLDDQVQMYCSNALLNHPLVSPVNQGSLGGLCPLLVIGGSGELLRDEIIYAAHKAADPARYPPSPGVLEAYPGQKEALERYPPTKVHLQIYDGCAHVTPTLAWTTPAKYQFRSCANFSIWAITAANKANERAERAAAKKKRAPSRQSTASSAHITTDTSGQPVVDNKAAEEANEEPVDEDDVESEASTDSDAPEGVPAGEIVSVTGSEPSYGASNIIRERVSTNGRIRTMEPEAELACLNLPPEHVGAVLASGPIKTWLKTRADWDKRFSKKLQKMRELKEGDRANAEAAHFPNTGNKTDVPPRTSLAAWYDPKYAREAGKAVDVGKAETSTLVAAWMRMGSAAEEEYKNEEKVEEVTEQLEKQGIDPEEAATSPMNELKKMVQ